MCKCGVLRRCTVYYTRSAFTLHLNRCLVWDKGIVDNWDYVFEKCVHSDVFVTTMMHPFINEFIIQEEYDYGYFELDGATAHTAPNSMETLCKVFDVRVIGTH